MLLDKKVPHNKKRNVGLVYEFLVRYIAKALLENKDQDIKTAKQILKTHFCKNSELLKELKGFKRLLESTFSSREMAIRFVDKLKIETLINKPRLESEKTILIHEINKRLNLDQEFFNQPIDDYKLYATIQTLLNSWYDKEFIKESFSYVAMLENNLVEHLIKNKEIDRAKLKEELILVSSYEPDKLLALVMRRKFEEKYSQNLLPEQHAIVSTLLFGTEQMLCEILTVTKNNLLKQTLPSELKIRVEQIEPQPSDEQVNFFLNVLEFLKEGPNEEK